METASTPRTGRTYSMTMGRDETATVGESRSERMFTDEAVGELAGRIVAERQRGAAESRLVADVREFPSWVAGVVTVDGSAFVCPRADAASVALVMNHAAAREALRGRVHTRADLHALAAVLGVSAK